MVERVFRGGAARPPVQAMIAFIEDQRDVFGAGPICRVPGIAPCIGRQATFHARAAIARDPDLASGGAKRDVSDGAAIKRVHDDSRGRYGARKIWHTLRREGVAIVTRTNGAPMAPIARCSVERLMRAMQIQGVVRGKTVITTNPDAAQPGPEDKVNRAFVAEMPNHPWVSDFTHVSSWQGVRYCPRIDGGQYLTLCRLRD